MTSVSVMDGQPKAGVTHAGPCPLEVLALVVDGRVEVEDHEVSQRRALDRGLDGEIEILRADGEHLGLGLGDDRPQRDTGALC